MTKLYRKGAVGATIVIVIGILICPGYLFAQTPDVEAKVKSVPQVTYPAEASKTGLEGKVTVVVDIDATGKVTKSNEAFGPDWVCPNNNRADVVAMRQLAQEAARKAVFIPASKDGKPVESQVRLTFYFKNPHPKEDTGGKLGFATTGTGSAPADASERGSGISLAKVGGTISNPSEGSTETGGAMGGAKVIMPEGSTADSETKTISGGVLNGKALVLAKPNYPAAAKAIRATGSVQVQVVIDTNGTMLSAEAKSGHPLLRAASVSAACSSRFAPTLLNNNPVLVAGIITYNFVEK